MARPQFVHNTSDSEQEVTRKFDDTVDKVVFLDTKNRRRVSSHVCTVCGRAFLKSAKLSRHMVSHTGERPNKCEFPGCEKTFSRKCHLQRHLLTHTGERKFKCTHDGCSMSFYESSHLRRHVLTGHSELKPFLCELCGDRFVKKMQLRKHSTSHTGATPFKCSEAGCAFAFSTLKQLGAHRALHRGRYFVCLEPGCSEVIARSSPGFIPSSICSSSNAADAPLFNSLNDLKLHVKTAHFVCQKLNSACYGSVFSSRTAFNSHMRMHEKRELKLKISGGGLQFNNNAEPVAPSGTLGGDIAEAFAVTAMKLGLQCSHCHKIFSKASNLRKHCKTVHLRQRSHVCSIPDCGASFLHKRTLVKHIQAIHADVLEGKSTHRLPHSRAPDSFFAEFVAGSTPSLAILKRKLGSAPSARQRKRRARPDNLNEGGESSSSEEDGLGAHGENGLGKCVEEAGEGGNEDSEEIDDKVEVYGGEDEDGAEDGIEEEETSDGQYFNGAPSVEVEQVLKVHQGQQSKNIKLADKGIAASCTTRNAFQVDSSISTCEGSAPQLVRGELFWALDQRGQSIHPIDVDAFALTAAEIVAEV